MACRSRRRRIVLRPISAGFVENSLRNLGVETLGIFYQHCIDPNTSVEVVADTVKELIREGKVLHFDFAK